MFEKVSMKKIVLWLLITMISSFTLGAILLSASGILDNKGSLFTANVYTHTINEKANFDTESLERILLTTQSEDIAIIPTEETKLRLYFHGSISTDREELKPKMRVNQNGSQLGVNIEWPEKWRRNFHHSLKLDVYLPKRYTKELVVQTASGNLTSGALTIDALAIQTASGACNLKGTMDRLSFQTASGDFSAEFVNSKTAVFDTKSGSVRLKGKFDSFTFQSASGQLIAERYSANNTKLNTISGSVKLVGPSTKSLCFESISGDLSVEAIGAQHVQLKTTSGRMALEGLKGDLTSKAVSGDLEVDYSDLKGNIVADSVSGNIRIRLPKEAAFGLEYNTKAGSFEMANEFSFISERQDSSRRVLGYVRNRNNKITVNTVSGNLALAL